jgi:hypothetical protein
LLLTAKQAVGTEVARALPGIARLLDSSETGPNDVDPDEIDERLERLEEQCAAASGRCRMLFEQCTAASSRCKMLSEGVAQAGARLAVAAREFAEQRGPDVSEPERRLLSAVSEMVCVAMGAAGVDTSSVLPGLGSDSEEQREAFGPFQTEYCSRCGRQWGTWGTFNEVEVCACEPVNGISR